MLIRDLPQLPTPVEENRSAKLLRYSKHGARLLGVAAHRITTRTIWWGAWGLMLGAVCFGVVWWFGLLRFPWPAAQPWIVAGCGVLYMLAGAGCWGHAGFWRGLGRFVLVLGVENGWVVSLLTAILDRVLSVLKSSTRVEGMMERSEQWAEDLPLARWEELLKEGSAYVIGRPEHSSNRLTLAVRRFVVKQIEKFMLRIVRAEGGRNGGGGVSMQRVRELGFELAESQFEGTIKGLMNKQLLLMTALFAGLALLPPLLAWGTRWYFG